SALLLRVLRLAWRRALRQVSRSGPGSADLCSAIQRRRAGKSRSAGANRPPAAQSLDLTTEGLDRSVEAATAAFTLAARAVRPSRSPLGQSLRQRFGDRL